MSVALLEVHQTPEQRRPLISALVVDDQPDEAESVQDMYRARGFERVDVVHSAHEALEVFKEYDVVIIDLNLGAEDGMDLVEAILAEQPDKWIFTMSGYPDLVRLMDDRNLPVLYCLNKPLSDDTERLFRMQDELALKKALRLAHLDELTNALRQSADAMAGSDLVLAQRSLTVAKQALEAYFLPTSRDRRKATGQPTSRRRITLLVWAVLQRCSTIPSAAHDLIVPGAELLSALADAVSLLERSGLTQEDEAQVDRMLRRAGAHTAVGSADVLAAAVTPRLKAE